MAGGRGAYKKHTRHVKSTYVSHYVHRTAPVQGSTNSPQCAFTNIHSTHRTVSTMATSSSAPSATSPAFSFHVSMIVAFEVVCACNAMSYALARLMCGSVFVIAFSTHSNLRRTDTESVMPQQSKGFRSRICLDSSSALLCAHVWMSSL